jgi:hypothetical protein
MILSKKTADVNIDPRFLGHEDRDAFFTRAQRSRMVYEILATAPFGKDKKGEVGIERLLGEGTYTAAFPLHDVSARSFFVVVGRRNRIQLRTLLKEVSSVIECMFNIGAIW